MSLRPFKEHLRIAIANNQSAAIFEAIVQIHRGMYTEENLPTAEDSILTNVNNALDHMWKKEGCIRDMAVYKSFIPSREGCRSIEVYEKLELERLLKKYGPPPILFM